MTHLILTPQSPLTPQQRRETLALLRVKAAQHGWSDAIRAIEAYGTNNQEGDTP